MFGAKGLEQIQIVDQATRIPTYPCDGIAVKGLVIGELSDGFQTASAVFIAFWAKVSQIDACALPECDNVHAETTAQ